MNRNKQLASKLAGALAVATLFGTSAFAETRHGDETRRTETRVERRDGEARLNRQVERDRTVTTDSNRDRGTTNSAGSWRNEGHRDTTTDTRRNEIYRNDNRNEDRAYDRNRADESRSYDRNRGHDNRSYDRNRGGDNRSYDRNRGYDNRSYDRSRGYDSRGRQPYYASGRVSRYERYNGGYRVWISGAPFPFFVPEVRFRAFPFRIGLSVRLGGYYNPLGYYDYYDGPAGPVYTSGDLRGVVESVDYRRGTMVLRDDISGSFVTTVMRGDDPRLGRLRPGDYVTLSGDWNRSGIFEAYRVDDLDYRR